MQRGLVLALSLALAAGAGGNAAADSLDEAVGLARRTLAYVEKRSPRPELSARLSALTAALPPREAAAARAERERAVRALRREILFSHPDLQFRSLLANLRTISYSFGPHMCDQCLGRFSRPGPGLIAIDDWKNAPTRRLLLTGKLPEGATLDPDLHWDGDRILFAFCDHTDRRTPLQKSVTVNPLELGPYGTNHWIGHTVYRVDPGNPMFTTNAWAHRPETAYRYWIYECAADGSWLRRVTGTARDPLATWEGRQSVLIEDIDPCYLPDGGIAFVSTRSQNFGRCHGQRYAPAFLLYRAEADGSGIRQLSWGEANEWEPAVLNDGRIAYTRWDYIDRAANLFHALWVMNPDGTGTAHLYGNYSPVPCGKSECKAVPGSRLILCTASAHHFFTAGSPILIDPRKGEDGPGPVTRVTPEVPFPEAEGPNHYADKGYYANPCPVNDTLFFASYSAEGFHFGDPAYCAYGWSVAWPRKRTFAVYLIDTLGGREKIYEDSEWDVFSPIPLRKTKRPPVIPSRLPARESAPDYGVCSVESVYNCREPLPRGSVAALRLNRILNKTISHHLDNAGGFPLYKQPIGTVPVAADGSACFRIPAEEPVQLQALDKDGMAIFTMRSFIYAQKGEQLRCIGCHENKMQSAPLAKERYALTAAIPAPVPRAENGVSFCRQVKPILDRHCIRCHGLGKDPKAKKIDLVGQGNVLMREGHSEDPIEAYATLIDGSLRTCLVRRAKPYQETFTSKVMDYYAAPSRLTALLRQGHSGVKLSKEEWEDLVLWMDMNAQCLASYSINQPEFGKADPAGVAALRAAVGNQFGSELAAEPLFALINPAVPESSRILKAPLPVEKGGWGQLANGYTDQNDPRYQAMLTLVRNAFRTPARTDFLGTCGRGDACRCWNCWVWQGKFNDPAIVHAQAYGNM